MFDVGSVAMESGLSMLYLHKVSAYIDLFFMAHGEINLTCDGTPSMTAWANLSRNHSQWKLLKRNGAQH